MSPEDRLAAFGEQVGFDVRAESDVVRALAVPCLLKDGTSSTCTIEKSWDATTGKPDSQIGKAVHAVRITTAAAQDGRVYNADGTPIGNHLRGDDETWSEISIRRGSQHSPEDDESAHEVIHRYAKQIVGAAWAAAGVTTAPHKSFNPFNIPNTFEDRAELRPVQDRIRGQRIAIIGLGGTGSHVLDLIAKAPVGNIHLLDCDVVEWHTLFRAPDAPTSDDIELVRAGQLLKVDYYASKYAPLRTGIHPHPIKVDGTSMWRDFLSRHPVDFAFVCIDQLLDCDSPRQDAVYCALSETEVPFIDSGVSITLEGDAVRGAVTTSVYAAGSLEWKTAVPNARVIGNRPGYRNVQLPEVNELAAALAVMEWRRQTEQYVSESTSFLHKLRLERPSIVAGPAAEEGASL